MTISVRLSLWTFASFLLFFYSWNKTRWMVENASSWANKWWKSHDDAITYLRQHTGNWRLDHFISFFLITQCVCVHVLALQSEKLSFLRRELQQQLQREEWWAPESVSVIHRVHRLNHVSFFIHWCLGFYRMATPMKMRRRRRCLATAVHIRESNESINRKKSTNNNIKLLSNYYCCTTSKW
jgi:hypothetical protein